MATTDAWGKALAYANVVSQLYTVGCTLYDCATSVVGHIPSYAQPTTGGDHHLIAYLRAAREQVRDRLRHAVYGPGGASDAQELTAETQEVLRTLMGGLPGERNGDAA